MTLQLQLLDSLLIQDQSFKLDNQSLATLNLTSNTGKLFVVSAPSGTGKTTLVGTVMERLDHKNIQIKRVITYTTKKPKKCEVPGKDYHFISYEEFEKKIDIGFFIEWSQAYGNYYGSPAYILEHIKQLQSYILIIDRVGWQQINGNFAFAVPIWIEPPSLFVLKQRLQLRGRDDLLDIQHRINLAIKEIQDESISPLYRYKIINDNFNQAADELEKIISVELLGNNLNL